MQIRTAIAGMMLGLLIATCVGRSTIAQSEVEIQTIGDVGVFSLAGQHEVYLSGYSFPVGTMTCAVHVSDPEDVNDFDGFDIVASPLGTGFLASIGSNEWTAAFDQGFTGTFFFNLNHGRYEYTIGGLSGYMIPQPQGTSLLVPSIPTGPRSAWSIQSFVDGGQGLMCSVYTGDLYPTFSVSVDWYRFVQFWCDYGYLDANLEEQTTNAPPGFSMMCSGNGRRGASPAQLGQGAGLVNLNGTTTYVDSATPGVPGYVESGGAGRVSPEGVSMIDRPGGTPTEAARTLHAMGVNMAGFTNRPITWISLLFEYDTYTVVNGDIVEHWKDWAFMMLDFRTDPWTLTGPEYTSKTQVPCNGSLDSDHQAAYDNFIGGGFAGAPANL